MLRAAQRAAPNNMQVDFYVLSQAGEPAVNTFACRLTEKAYKQGLRVHLLVADETTLDQLDEQLWTFRDGSFIPHDRLANGDGEAPVTLSLSDQTPQNADVAIVLDCDVPDTLGDCNRIAEIVGADDAARNRSRERFRGYRSRGIEPVTHHIDA